MRHIETKKEVMYTLEFTEDELMLIYNILNKLSISTASDKYKCTEAQAKAIVGIFEVLHRILEGNS